MQKELVNLNFSDRESAHIVKFIGGHLGHVQDFLQTMKIANGKLLVRGKSTRVFSYFQQYWFTNT